MVGISENDLILLSVGAGGLLWCTGLVLWLVYVDGTHRAKAVRQLGEALFTMLTQMGEHGRQNDRRQNEGTVVLPLIQS
jgi:hypothetical protein